MAYDWIVKDRADVEKKLKDGRKGYHDAPRRCFPRKGFVDRPCPHCGFEPIGFRKTCAACARRLAA